MTRPTLPAATLILGLLVPLAWLSLGLASGQDQDELYGESGPVEMFSALYLLLAGVALMILPDRAARWHQVLLLVAAALREMDWDKSFTENGILSLRHYSGAAPLVEKILGAVVVLAVLAAGLRLLRRDLVPWLGGLRRGSGIAWLWLGAIVMLVLAKAGDGLDRKLAGFGISLPEGAMVLIARGEEVLELVASVLILTAIAVLVAPAPPPR
ncbi:hypothetical protein [Paracoccus sp. NSM]|uniref:hypothetical protein n=1 Tax=Paracoccus sp. NSM TaxID=3457784 RepID=UPI0040351C00